MTTAIPFTKSVTIYRSEKFISIEPLSGASALRYREDGDHRTYLEPGVANEVLGLALLAALNRSRFVDPSSDDGFFDADRATRAYKNWQKDFMARYGYKSKRDAYKNMNWCLAEAIEEKISIEPHRRDKPGYWKSLPPDRTVIVPLRAGETAIGAALALAFSRCE